ncbi:MAG: response regulator [Pseudomonadota bacterium]
MSPDPRLAGRISEDPRSPAATPVGPCVDRAQREKFDSLALLAGSVAHDFNNLLTAILGHAELAMMQLPQEAGARHQVERIAAGARRAADLAASLLAFAGRGPVVLEPLDLGLLVEETLRLLKASSPAVAAVSLGARPGPMPVKADGAQLRRALTLLVGHALRARESEPGPVLVQCTNGRFEQDQLDGCLVAAGGPGRYACVEIVGPGPERGDLCASFVPYATETTDAPALGLPFVLGVARAHGGALCVRGSVGVALLLPLVEGASVEPALPEPAAALARERCVLVVDDEESVREVIREILTRAGYRVLVAADGAEALEIFTALEGEIHGVLLDLTMPRMNGVATFRALRARAPRVRVLLMSGYSESDSVQRFGEDGLSGFVQKPFAARTLLAALEAGLGGA